MILTPAEMQAAEAQAFARGASAEALMEQAGAGIARAIERFVPGPGHLVLYLGLGHNAGDALVAARHLAGRGWSSECRWVGPAETASPLTRRQHRRWQDVPRPGRVEGSDRAPCVLLDGLLGIGARPGLREDYRKLTREWNRRRCRGSVVGIALDIPTGLDGSTGTAEDDAVRADYTFTISCAKSGLVADEALGYTGRLEVIPLPEILPREAGLHPDVRLSLPAWLAPRLPVRTPDWHKGRAGRVAIIAGSPGMTGAADLASRAAVRAGAGLVTLLAHPSVAPTLAGRCAAEVMVRPTPGPEEADLASYDGIAVGPGLGPLADGWRDGDWGDAGPVVADADFLNALARQPERLAAFVADESRLLTPHPGEFRRLAPSIDDRAPRLEQARAFRERSKATLLLKGARSVIATPGTPLSLNPTGTPGMASGGMGDVLTGVCAALIAQGMAIHEAACAGAWLCGRAAEIRLHEGVESPESLAATDVIARLGAAFTALRAEAGG